MYPSSSLLSGHMNAVSYPMYFIFTFDLVWKDGTGTTAGSTLSFLTLLQWFHPIISSAGAQLISQWFLWGAEHWENTCTPSHLLRHRPNPANISLREMKTKSQIKLKKKTKQPNPNPHSRPANKANPCQKALLCLWHQDLKQGSLYLVVSVML